MPATTSPKSPKPNLKYDTPKMVPLTRTQHQAIAKAAPKRKGKIVGSLLLKH